MDLHLRGKSVLITGASKGIGAAAAEAFAEEGCNVHLAARNSEALKVLTKSLGGRSLHHGIRVVGINPGPVQTDRIISLMKTRAKTQLGDESRYGELMKNFPQGRAAKPREIADMMAFLASDRSGYTSGVIVTIDGAASR